MCYKLTHYKYNANYYTYYNNGYGNLVLASQPSSDILVCNLKSQFLTATPMFGLCLEFSTLFITMKDFSIFNGKPVMITLALDRLRKDILYDQYSDSVECVLVIRFVINV